MTSAQPFVSVVVPVRNDAARLRTCVAALRVQSYPSNRYEIIVDDNASHEPVVLEHRELPITRVVRNEGPGSYAARNAGIAASCGDVLAFTDSDCVPAAEWLEKAVARLTAAGPGTALGGRVA